MRAIDQIDDPTELKQIATLLSHENERLHRRLQVLLRELAELRGGSAQESLALEIAQLQEQLANLQRRMFADSSEKRPQAPSAPKEKKPRRGHGPRSQAQLPIVEAFHDLAPEDRTCPVCDGELEDMSEQTEDSEEITVVMRQFQLVRHRRRKYRCRCNGAVVTAPGPPKLIPGGRYSVEFAVEVAAAKYLDHLPLDRQQRIMKREGLVVDTQTLWDQINALARHLQPNGDLFHARILASPILQADETWWRLMAGRPMKRWWAWCLANEDTVLYRILPSRSAKAAAALLDGYQGVVFADGYGAYEALARAGPGISLAHCWAHVRRKYVEAEPFYPRESREILDLIGELFATEKLVPSAHGFAGEDREALLETRRQLRDARSRTIVMKIHDAALEHRALPKSALGRAGKYMLKIWPGLTRFLDDPRIPLHNNRVEQALRGVVVGRKVHYGSRSLRGTEVATLFYSLVETAKMADVDPKAYLLEAAKAAINSPGTTIHPRDLLGS